MQLERVGKKDMKELIKEMEAENCTVAVARPLYKVTDLENGDKWYFDSMREMKAHVKDYIEECEGDCILIYRVLNYETGKYRRMTGKEVIEARLPR